MKRRIVLVFTLLAAAVLFLLTIILSYGSAGGMEFRGKQQLEWTVGELARAAGDTPEAVDLVLSQPGSGPTLHVLGRQGELLAGPDRYREVFSQPALQSLMEAGMGSVGLNAGGEPLVAAVAALGDGGYLVALTDLASLGLVPVRWLDILPVMAIILIIFALAVYLLTGYILEPLSELTRATARISSGELSSRIKVNDDPELRRLAGNFNTLSDRLETTILVSLGNQNQLEAILGSMNSGVIAVDKNNRIIIFNPFARKIFGIYSDAIGKDIRDVIHSTDLDKMLTVSEQFQELSLRKNNTTIVRYKTTSLAAENSSEQGKVTVIQDITDLKKLEQMRTQFVANVSHELKTPLTSIKGFTETLRNVEDQATREKFLDIIDAESERLQRLIEDILSLSSIESTETLKGDIVDAATVTIASLRLLEVQARDKNIDLSLIIKGEPEFIGDADMFRQLVINLADNAIKYTEPNGKVKVRLEEEADAVILSIQDTGIGIARDHLPRLFERFYRVDKSRNRAMGGTGLGLAIVKHIAIAFDGTIQVESEEGKGTTFTVTLPSHRTRPEAGATRIQSYKFNE